MMLEEGLLNLLWTTLMQRMYVTTEGLSKWFNKHRNRVSVKMYIFYTLTTFRNLERSHHFSSKNWVYTMCVCVHAIDI